MPSCFHLHKQRRSQIQLPSAFRRFFFRQFLQRRRQAMFLLDVLMCSFAQCPGYGSLWRFHSHHIRHHRRSPFSSRAAELTLVKEVRPLRLGEILPVRDFIRCLDLISARRYSPAAIRPCLRQSPPPAAVSISSRDVLLHTLPEGGVIRPHSRLCLATHRALFFFLGGDGLDLSDPESERM